MSEYSTVYLRSKSLPPADEWERAHNFYMYPLALAEGKCVHVTDNYHFFSDNVGRICRLFMKFLAYTILYPLMKWGKEAGAKSASYKLISEQHAWMRTPATATTFASARALFPARGIARIIKDAGDTRKEGHVYRDDLFVALREDENLRQELKRNGSLVTSVAELCGSVDNFRMVLGFLGNDKAAACFIKDAIFSKGNASIWPALSEEELSAVFNTPIRSMMGKDSTIISYFGLRRLVQLTQDKSPQFRPMVSTLLPLWNETCMYNLGGEFSLASPEELQNFFSWILFPDAKAIFAKLIDGIHQDYITKEKREAVWGGFLGGRLEALSDEDLTKLYDWFSLPAGRGKGDPELLARLLYPKELRGPLLAKALECLERNACLTDRVIAQIAGSYLSIEKDRRAVLPERIRQKFQHLEPPIAVDQ